MARRRKVRTTWWAWLALAAVAAAVFAAGIYIGQWRQGDLSGWFSGSAELTVPQQRPTPRVEKVPQYKSPPSTEGEPTATVDDPPAPAVEEAVSGPVGRVALVIDDLGRSLDEVAAVADLGVPMTFAVLPFETRTPEVVADLRRREVEILCHLPMEPAPGADPGPGALTLSMSRRKLGKAARAALDAVPGAVGVNNHMGSVLTSDPRAMEAVLKVLEKRELFFLDSRTSADTLGYKTARRMGVPTVERQVFLDPDLSPDAIVFQFRRLLEIARLNGTAVGIGHPHPETVEILRREIPRARQEGFEFVPVSYLLDRGHALEQ